MVHRFAADGNPAACFFREVQLTEKNMPPDGPRPYDLITDRSDLDTLAAELTGEQEIGVDLEADSMFHFRERVCLLQIASPRTKAVVDTVSLQDLSPLKPVFRNSAIRKVFHGSDYDVRSLFRDFDIRINNLFDTELACRFLGYRESGLEAVLKNFFGVELNKKYQRKDWSLRPLPVEMLSYAVADVEHLVPLARRLESELRALDRYSWVIDECRLLSRVRPAASGAKPLFLSCKGSGRLDPRGLAVLEALLAFRKELAHARDRPLFKVFSHQTLLQLAEHRPTSVAELERSGALSAAQVERHGRRIVAAVKEALRLPADQLPSYPYKKPQRVAAAVSDRIQLLRRFRESKARRLKIEPSLVLSKAAVHAIAVRKPAAPEDLAEIDELKPWQRKAFGRDIIAALQKR
jgi:ribonuclease D